MIDAKLHIDAENEVVQLAISDYFTAFRLPRSVASKVVTSAKSPYADVFKRNGVYILIEDDCKCVPKFYIGKARPFARRFQKHISPATSFKESHLNWTDAILFVGESLKFSKWGSDEVEWFEDRLLKDLRSVGNYEATNKDSGTYSHGSVDEVGCGKQLTDMEIVAGLLGYPKLFKSTATTPPATIKKSSQKKASKKGSAAKKKGGVKDPFYGFTAIVVRALMDHIFAKGLVSQSDISEFTSQDSHATYCVGSSSDCLLMVPYEKQAVKSGGLVRYYPQPYTYKKKKYALSSQLFARNLPAFKELALRYGIDVDAWASLCSGRKDEALAFLKSKGL